MLFFKLYNWLKYKTMPSSFLFKNRLFVERDSKHRRIVNNFGLTFRNSKWSNYENSNVTWDFRNHYFSFFIAIFVASIFLYLIIFLNFTNNFFFNLITFFFWFTVDSFDYYLTFVIWSFLSFLSFSLSKLYIFVLNNNNINEFVSAKESFSKFKVRNDSLKSNEFFLSKNDLNWILYSWLTSDNVNNKYSSKCIELMFDSNVSKNIWTNNYDFFINLYQTVFFLNLNKKNFYYYQNSFDSLTGNDFFKVFNFFNDTKILNNYFSLILSYYYKKDFYYSNKKNFSKNFNNSFYESKWNLESLDLEVNKNNFLINGSKGYFFLNNVSIFDLSKEFKKFSNFFFFKNLLIKNTLEAEAKFSKWNRWLYRYSLLHRKSIKYAQKLTFTKKLMNNGFYNSSIFKKNLWNSVHFNSKNLQSTQMTTFFDSYFNDFLNFKDKNFSQKPAYNSFLYNDKTNFLNFNFLENSYFWHLKRFFLFNNLKTNFFFFKLNLKTKNTNSVDKYKSQNLNNFFFNLFIKNRALFLTSFDLINVDNAFLNNLNSQNSFDKSFEDIFYSSNDIDLFNKENLILMNTISSNSFFKSTNFLNSFFFLNFEKNIFLNKKTNFFFKNLYLNHIYFLHLNSFFFKDLFIFNLFIK